MASVNEQHHIPGYELYQHNFKRDEDSFKDGITKDEMITRNQGKTKQKTSNQQTRERKAKEKHKLQQQVFALNLAKHLHTESPSNKAYAFEAVTNHKAQVLDTESLLKTQLEAKQNKLKDIDTLRETTKTVLQQTEAQRTVQQEHTRIASFSQKKTKESLQKQIDQFFKNPRADKENIISFITYCPTRSPEIELALFEINATRGEHMGAIAQLIPLIDNNAPLIDKLAELIKKAPVKGALEGFDLLIETSKKFEILKKVVEEKEPLIRDFQKKIADEKAHLLKVYEEETESLLVKKGIYRFFCQDRLLYILLTKKIDKNHKKWSWFYNRLHLKVSSLLKKPTIEEINRFVAFGKDAIEKSSNKKFSKSLKETQTSYKELHQRSLLDFRSSHRSRGGKYFTIRASQSSSLKPASTRVRQKVGESTLCKNRGGTAPRDCPS